VEVNTGEKDIMQDRAFLQLASSIIDTRDNINALFHEKHKAKLLILGEERDLLQFFRNADSQEEFFFRVCALANVVTKLNIQVLRELTKITDPQIKSIKLFEEYLKKNKMLDNKVIKTFQSINNLRQGYPVHGDRSKGVLKAHEYFSLDYPVVNFNEAWKTLLLNYLDALKRLLQKFKG
jgi:hypothetical protein